MIVELGQRRLERLEDLFAALRGRRPGQRVAVKVVRDGKTMSVDVTLSARASG